MTGEGADPDDDGASDGSGEDQAAVDRRLRGDRGLSADQRAVFDAHFGREGVVCAPAGSGTGKTTTAVEVVAEAVHRRLSVAPDRNPFESVLVTTFTRDAARQLKVELRERLRTHRRQAPDDDPVVRRWEDLSRWLETASNVRTIDSFAQDLLREVAAEVGVPPSFRVADGLSRSELLEAVFEDLTGDPDLAGPVERLAAAYPGDDRDGWRSMVVALHRRCREFCLSPAEAARELSRSVYRVHAGREPETFADLLAIVDDLADFDPEFFASNVADPDAWVEFAADTYETTRRLAGDFGVVLKAFADRYDRRSRERGVLTHTDITHLLRAYLAGETDADDRRRRLFARSLRARFEHVVVDEFQDTNYAQCRVLARLVEGPDALVIGDLKQSVYEWRSAEPRLFADLVAYARDEAETNVLDADRVHCRRLTDNFRSHPDLVRTANAVFPDLFDDPGRGAIGSFPVEYDRLTPRRIEAGEQPRVHTLEVDPPEDHDGSRRTATVRAEADRVAAAVRGALDEGLPVDPDRTVAGDPDPRPVRPGDVAVLFRSRRQMGRYSRALERYGVDNAVLGTGSLFETAEVRALVDVLAWLADPTDPDRVERLADSPAAGLDERAREAVTAVDGDLDRALSRLERAGDDRPDDDRSGDRNTAGARERLAGLCALARDVRVERPDPADVVADVLAHTGFDLAALGGPDGRRRYANCRRLLAVVDDWEGLSYGDVVDRLDRLVAGAVEDDTRPAAVADADSPSTVKLLTAHAAKGLEFPVVVLADTAQAEAYHRACEEPFVADRRHGLAIQPRTGDAPPPDPAALPTFENGWFADGDVGFALDRGLLWLSERRGTDGRLRHDHPFQGAVRDARAEFWRLLYVAFTRACDHLVVPLTPPDRGDPGTWTTWSAALAEHLGEGDLSAPGGEVAVGHDDLPDPDPPARGDDDPLAVLAAATGTDGDAADGGDDHPVGGDAPRTRGRFRPATLGPAGGATLLSAPARFRRRHLLGSADPLGRPTTAGSAAGRPAGPGTDPPDGLAPATWGRLVREAVTTLCATVGPGGLAAVAGADESLSDDEAPAWPLALVSARAGVPRAARAAVRRRLCERTLPAVAGTAAFEDCRRAEVVVAGAVTAVDAGPVLVGGGDVRYRVDGEWHLLAVATGRPPGDDRRERLAVAAGLRADAAPVPVERVRVVTVADGTATELSLAPVGGRWRTLPGVGPPVDGTGDLGQ